MADHFYGIAPGGSIGDVTADTSTTSKSVELRVADGTMSKTSLLLAIDAIRAHIATDSAPA